MSENCLNITVIILENQNEQTNIHPQYPKSENTEYIVCQNLEQAVFDAHGKYLLILNSRCSLPEGMPEKMMLEAENAQADLLLCGYRLKQANGSYRYFSGHEDIARFRGRTVIENTEYQDQTMALSDGILYTKLFRTDFFKKYQLCLESCYVSARLGLALAERIAWSDDCYVCLNEKPDETDCKELYDALNRRGLYEKYRKAFSLEITNYCTALIAHAESNEELDQRYESVQQLLSYVQMSEADAQQFLNSRTANHMLSLPYIKETRRKYFLRKQKKESVKVMEADERISVSVVIPVYNVEKYLEDCLDSIVNQTLHEIEIICVNDGSDDGSLDILNRYAEKDSRITVISQENEGQSGARNTALDYVKGRYVYFMDADDILEIDALEKTYQIVKENDLDLIYFDGSSFAEEGVGEEAAERYRTYYSRKYEYEGSWSGPDLFAAMYANGEWRVSPCLQLIRTALISQYHLRFEPGIIHEDNIFSFMAILYAKKAGYLHEILFNRRVRASSTMTSARTYKNVIGYFICYLKMQAFLDKMELEENVCEQAQMCIFRILHNARNDYKAVEAPQKFAYEGLSESEKILFLLHVQESIQGSEMFAETRERMKKAETRNAELKNELKRYENELKRYENELKKCEKELALEREPVAKKMARKVKKMF